MSTDVNAAATLSLAIDTGGAEVKLKELQQAYAQLRAELNTQSGKGSTLSNVGKDAGEASARVKTLEAEVGALRAKLDGLGAAARDSGKSIKVGLQAGLGGFSATSILGDDQIAKLKARLKKAGVEAAAALESGLTNANFSKTNQALRLLEQNTEQSLKRLRALSIEAQSYAAKVGSVSANARYGSELVSGAFGGKATTGLATLAALAAEEQKLKDSAKAMKELGQAKNQANLLELKLIKVEEAQRLKASVKDAQDLAKWLALTEKQRASATLQAARAQYGGGNQSLLPGVAGSSHALAAAQSVGSIQGAQAALDALSVSQHKAATAAGVHEARIKGMPKHMWEAHSAARGLAGGFNALWLTYGATIPLIAGATLSAGFVKATKAGAEFQHQLTFVKALGGESAAEVAKIGDEALKLAKSSLYGPVELSKGLRILAQAGLTAAQSMQALPTVMDLATVGEMDMGEAAVTLAGVMNAFSLTVQDMPRIGDIFAKAAALSQTSVVGLTNSMRTASVVGEQYGVKMEDAAAALTVLAKINITGTAAGTSLRNMVREIYAPVPQSAGLFKRLKVETTTATGDLRSFSDVLFDLQGKLSEFDKGSQVKILQRLFGERGAKEAIAILAQTREEWNKLVSDLSNADGFNRQVSSALEVTTFGRFKNAANTLQATMIQAFQSAEPAVSRLADSLRDLAESALVASSLKAIVSLVSNVGSALVTVTPLVLGFGAAWAALKAITLIEAGLAAAAISLGTLSTTLAATTAATGAAGVAMTATSGAAGLLSGALGGLAAVAAPLVATLGALYVAYQTYVVDDSVEAAGRLTHDFASAMKRLADKTEEANARLREQINLKKGLSVADGSVKAVDDAGRAVAEIKAKRDASMSKLYGNGGGTPLDWVNPLNAARAGYYNWQYVRAEEKRREGVSNLALASANNREGQDLQKQLQIQGLEEQLDDAVARLERKKVKFDSTSAKIALDAVKGATDPTTLRRSIEVAREELGKLNTDALQSGTKKWSGGREGGNPRLPKDYDTNLEKSRIQALENQQKRELDILSSSQSAKLISEEEYRFRLQGIHATYDAKLEAEYAASKDRLLALVASTSGDEQKRAETGYNNLRDAYRRYTAEKELRIQQSADREKGAVKRSFEETNKFIDAQAVKLQKAKQTLDDAKSAVSLSPEALAGRGARRAVEDDYAQTIAERQRQIDELKKALDGVADKKGISASSIYADSSELQAYIKDMERLKQARDQDAEAAQRQAESSTEYMRSFEYGWSRAYRSYLDTTTDYAKQAEDIFNKSVDGMSSAFASFVSGGKADFRGMITSLLQDLLKMQSKDLFGKLIGSLDGKGASGLFSFLLPGGGKTSAPAESGLPSGLGDAVQTEGLNVFSQAISGASSAVGGMTTATQGLVQNGLAQQASAVANSVSQELMRTSTEGAASSAATTALWNLASAAQAAGASMGSSSSGGGLGGLGGMFGSLFSSGGGGAASSAMTSTFSSAFGFAKGGVMDTPSLSRYSNQIHDTPKFFAFAKGAGVFGEAGPEAIMPLGRDAQGRLGVRTAGGGNSTTGDVNITIVVNEAEGGDKKSGSGDAGGSWSAFAERIRGMVLQELVTQKRPGGMLYT